MPFPETSVVTIERFIMEQERRFPEATGELSNLLYDIALGAKIIASAVRRAGLINILGSAQAMNVQGEEQQKLDVFANDALKNSMSYTGRVCVMASEEDEEVIPIAEDIPHGKYAVLFDPLDGSSNIDNNNPVGTIFSVYRRLSMEGHGTLGDVLQPGRQQCAAGYVMYGSSVMLVYTRGRGFTALPWIPPSGSSCSPTRTSGFPRADSTTASTRATSGAGPGECSGPSEAFTATGPTGSRARTAGISARWSPISIAI
jgi:fructose-1,6-bisphosphatase I